MSEMNEFSTMRKIVKIQGAKGAGLFDGWSMTAATEHFSRVNVIYGGNGSGKSTLARIFSHATNAIPTDIALHIEVSDSTDSVRRVTDRSDPFWARLRVFDKSFVEKNLLFDIDGRSDALPLLVLGAPNVQRDQRLAEIDARLENIATDLPAARKLADGATNTAKKLATDTARTISQELQAAGGRYAARSYDARRVVEGLEALDVGTAYRSDTDIAVDLLVVFGQRMEPVSCIHQTHFQLDHLESETAKVLGETVTSTAVKELVGNPSAEQWVQRGLQLHSEREKCLFCANRLSADRRSVLESHFDESFKRLQERIEAIDKMLVQEDEALG